VKHKLFNIHKQHIFLTPKESSCVRKRIFLTTFKLPLDFLKIKTKRVYISTFGLKHLYDKRTAREYEYLLQYLSQIIISPDAIYKNSSNRHGNIVLHKLLPEGDYIIVLQLSQKKNRGNYVLTGFRVKQKELNKFKLLWKREAGTPPSSR